MVWIDESTSLLSVVLRSLWSNTITLLKLSQGICQWESTCAIRYSPCSSGPSKVIPSRSSSISRVLTIERGVRTMDLTGIAGLFIHLLSFTRPHFVHPLIMYLSDLLETSWCIEMCFTLTLTLMIVKVDLISQNQNSFNFSTPSKWGGLFFFCYHALPRIRHSYACSIRCEPRNIASQLPKEKGWEGTFHSCLTHDLRSPWRSFGQRTLSTDFSWADHTQIIVVESRRAACRYPPQATE